MKMPIDEREMDELEELCVQTKVSLSGAPETGRLRVFGTIGPRLLEVVPELISEVRRLQGALTQVRQLSNALTQMHLHSQTAKDTGPDLPEGQTEIVLERYLGLRLVRLHPSGVDVVRNAQGSTSGPVSHQTAMAILLKPDLMENIVLTSTEPPWTR